MKHQQYVNCIFSSWYNNFKDITFKSKIIKLSPEFIEYLQTDGIILPDEEEIKYSNDLEGYSDSDDDDDGEVWDSVPVGVQSSKFPQLKIEVESAIKELGGGVFPKLNWSSPKDATWISHNRTLKCSTFNEICLLLKSSDFVAHDLNDAYEYCEDDSTNSCPNNDQYELVLRQWYEITRGMEFRCFVKQHKLVRICQRHITSYFEYLLPKKQSLFHEISNLYNSKIKDKFADTDYVFDVYTDNNVYYVVDFNPFGLVTDALLFSWDELFQLDPADVDINSEDIFAIVTESSGIQPSELMRYGMPTDLVDLAHGEDINKMIDFLNLRNLIRKPGNVVNGEDE